MKNRESAVIVIVGRDHTGILAAAAAVVAKEDGNVINVNQTVMDGFFSMTMIIDITNLKSTLDVLEEEIQKSVPDMKVKVMHENIFDAMHTI